MFVVVADERDCPHPPERPARHSAIRNATLVLFCLAIAHSAAQTAQPDDQPRKLDGTVINSVTRVPVQRALVFSSDNRLAKLTDSEGHVEFTIPTDKTDAGVTLQIGSGRIELHGCSSWLMARKPGFVEGCIDSSATTNSLQDEVTIALVPEALINGRVTLPNSDPLSETDVQLFFRDVVDGLPRWVPRNIVRTNSAGEFRFAELHAGEYKLLSHERPDDDLIPIARENTYGYPPVFYPGAADFDSAAMIHLSAGQEVDADLSAVRQPYYRVNIPVNGDFSFGIGVNVHAQAGPGFSLGYNPGMKRIEGFLPNGNYLVEGTANGPNAASGTVNLKVNGTAVEGPTMTLVPASSITLDVKEQFSDKTWNGSSSWSDGKRTFTSRGTRAYLQPRLESADDTRPMPGGMLRPPARPNDESLVFENVMPGRYWLQLYASRGYVASARMGSVDLLHEPLVVTPGLSAPIEIEMRDDASEIDGTVSGLASPGAGYQGTSRQAWIYCIPLPDSPGQYQQLFASEDGHFNHPKMAPGAYRILAFASEHRRLPFRDAEAMKAYESKGQVVHLSAGQKVSLQVSLITDDDASEK